MTVKALKKQLMAAIAMVVVSAIALSSSTYAWFAANTEVTATGMNVQAMTESGLVISNSASGTYNMSVTSATTTRAELKPGSTSDLTNWFHSTSNDPSLANTQNGYEPGTAWADNVTYGNYIVHNFYIRSSSNTALSMDSLDVKEVVAKVGENASASVQDLSKSLRVGVKIGTDKFIYAPVTGATSSYTVTNQVGAYDAGEGKRTAVNPKAYNAVSNAGTITSVPANSADGQLVQVFVWFEGEDENCISNNIAAALEGLTVTVTFTYTPPTTTTP